MKKLVIIKDNVTIHPIEKSRIYHDVEGTYDGHYFFAKTDNSHKSGYANYGINKGSVYILDVWKGGHPVGRNSIQGKGIHVARDFIAGYYNKWDVRPRTIVNKTVVNKIVAELEKISRRKIKTSTQKTSKKIHAKNKF